MKPPSLLYPTGVLLGFLIDAGCRIMHPNHCSVNEGDATCAAGGLGTYCNECQMENEGCVDEMPMGGCYFPGPSEEASMGDDGITSSEATTAPQPMTTEPAESSTGMMPCTSDEDCTEVGAPFCDPDSGTCVACDAMADPDDACAAREPDAPLCIGGECVQCTSESSTVCDADLRVCDPGSNTCVACTEHEQCTSGACELAEGRGYCFPPEAVVHVDGDGGHDYTDIQTAVMDVEGGGLRIIVVHELDGAASYSQGVYVDGGKIIAMRAAMGEAPILQGTAGAPGLRVEDAATLYVEGLGIMGNTAGRGVEVDGGLVWLDRSRVVQNSEGGILAQNGASLTLRNCFVGGDFDVISVEIDGASADILYSTVGTAIPGLMAIPSLHCTNPLEVHIRNSIVVSYGGLAGTELACEGASVTHSVTEEDEGIDFDPGWFVDFNDGAFWLTDAGTEALLDIAQWQAGDPVIDIDGDSRPTVGGASDYPGADRPSP